MVASSHWSSRPSTALFAVLWSGVFTLVIALAIKHTIGWRINEDDEQEGVDYCRAR